ncbi:MAG: lysine--tRNA ligase [Clostridia bacterium]
MEQTIANSTENLGAELEVRKAKIMELKASGNPVYQEKFERTHTIEEARKLEPSSIVSIAGRIVFKRVMGKLSFLAIQDVSAKIQISIGRNEISEDDFNFYKKMVDVGDFIGITGELYLTHTGELTVRTHKYQLLSKAMRPLPEKFHGLTDIEAKYRQRYLDLIMNEDSRKVLLGRSKVISFIRRFLEKNGFIEVETPILQSACCGASAKPFFTKHNALNKMCNLRIAPEVYLKQVIAAGYDRVFEVAKCFRNEGMDTQHLQEFTMVEWYASYWNYEDNIKFYTSFIQNLLTEVLGTTKVEFQGKTLDFGGELPRIDYTETLKKELGFDFLVYDKKDDLVAKVESTGLFKSSDFTGIKTVGGVIDLMYKKLIREKIEQPTVLYNYPACLVPLARRKDGNSKLIEMFQVLADGIEMCKAYSELVDPIIQRQTLEEQAAAKSQGDDEAMEFDTDFVLAMEHGMPPISGLGFGIDRLVTIMFNQPSIRDVVLFPLMK